MAELLDQEPKRQGGRSLSKVTVAAGLRLEPARRSFAAWTLLLALIVSILALQAEETQAGPMLGLREPALSPDGSRLVFVYGGDLWLVPVRGGAAQRLTDSPADEHRPVWSPVGERLAFASDEAGNDDVWVMALDRSERRRLTHGESSEIPSGFLPDGSGVIYHTGGPHGARFLRVVAATGGEPRTLVDDAAFDGVVSPTGQSLAFTQGLVPWWRQGYRGPAATAVTVLRAETRHPVRPGVGEMCNQFPQWGRSDRYLYYVSDESPARNVWLADLDSGSRWQLTSHSDGPVFHLSVAEDGSRLAYEQNGRIWVADLPAEREIQPRGRVTSRRVDIDSIPRETLHTTVARPALVDRGLTTMHLASAEDAAVVMAFGELYALPLSAPSRPELVDLSRDPRRDRDPSLSPDGRRLVFSSDRNGNYDLFMLESDQKDEPRVLHARRHKVRTFRDNYREERLPQFSPDGRYVAFVRRDEEETLWLADATGGREIAIAEGRSFESFQFSPDGRWIAYARSDELGQMDVYVVSLFGAGEHNVSQHPGRDDSPVWSPDGRWLVFVSDRAGSRDLWGVRLRAEDAADLLGSGDTSLMGPRGPRFALPPRQASPPTGPEVVIEAPGLAQRVVQLTRLYGDETSPRFSPRDGSLCFLSQVLGDADLWRLDRDAVEPTRLTHGDVRPKGIHPLSDGSFLLFTDAGAIERWPSAGPAEGRIVPFRLTPPPQSDAERAQILGEAWRILRDGFYDRYLHLARWKDAWESAESRLPSVATRAGLNDLLHRMTGVLNASHVGARVPGPTAGDSRRLGLEPSRFEGPWLDLPARFAQAESEPGVGVEIGRVLPGGPFDVARWQSAPRSSVLGPGDLILAVDGRPVGRVRSLAEALAESDGAVHRVLCLAKGASVPETLRVSSVSTERLHALEALEWEAQRAEIARVLSANRFAYVHLDAVERASVDQFERDLFLQRDKEGLILDLRNNPGGGDFERVLRWFSSQPTVYRQGRGEARLAVPQVGWAGPIVVLVDGTTASAAELLAHAIQVRGGRVVGPGTYRGVIGTEEVEMIDGSLLRLPHTGWYTPEGINLENRGVAPDRRVTADFEEARTGTDRILAQGVQELFQLLDRRGRR